MVEEMTKHIPSIDDDDLIEDLRGVVGPIENHHVKRSGGITGIINSLAERETYHKFAKTFTAILKYSLLAVQRFCQGDAQVSSLQPCAVPRIIRAAAHEEQHGHRRPLEGGPAHVHERARALEHDVPHASGAEQDRVHGRLRAHERVLAVSRGPLLEEVGRGLRQPIRGQGHGRVHEVEPLQDHLDVDDRGPAPRRDARQGAAGGPLHGHLALHVVEDGPVHVPGHAPGDLVVARHELVLGHVQVDVSEARPAAGSAPPAVHDRQVAHDRDAGPQLDRVHPRPPAPQDHHPLALEADQDRVRDEALARHRGLVRLHLVCGQRAGGCHRAPRRVFLKTVASNYSMYTYCSCSFRTC
jgi:hypothetical protein